MATSRPGTSDFSKEKLEEDPAWRMLQKPAKPKKYISPEKLEAIWQE